jgi:hypothetical protein
VADRAVARITKVLEIIILACSQKLRFGQMEDSIFAGKRELRLSGTPLLLVILNNFGNPGALYSS